MTLDPELISQAIVIWIGRVGVYPSRKEDRLVETFGAETAARLLPHLQELEGEFFASEAKNTTVGLLEGDVIAGILDMGKVAAQQFKLRHPEISDDAVNALALSYMYNNK